MKEQSSLKIITLAMVIALIIGGIYLLLTPKTYMSKSQVAIFRIKVENPDSSTEESRNRWVWIRDGLNIKSALITDEDLRRISLQNPEALKLKDQFANEPLWLEHLKKMINIQFTGADEFNFLVEVRAEDPKLAFDLNTMVFQRIKYLATTADQKNFEAVINVLKQKKKEHPEATAFYQDKIQKMTFNNILEQKQKENNFQVVSSPLENEVPVWPKSKLVLLAFLFMGLVFGLALDYFFKNMKK